MGGSLAEQALRLTVFALQPVQFRFVAEFVAPGRCFETNIQFSLRVFKTTGLKDDGAVFMTYERTMLIPKRGHAVDDLL